MVTQQMSQNKTPTHAIDGAEIPDETKAEIHHRVKRAQKEYLKEVGDAITNVLGLRTHAYVGAGANGPMLRMVPAEQIELTKAIAEYAGLECVHDLRTNPSNDRTWLRFRLEEVCDDARQSA